MEGNGNRRTFVCPFHGWCWGIDGRNTFVLRPEAFAEHNLGPDDLRLVSVRCELWGGCAWINLDDDAPALRDCFEPFASIYDAWKVESLRVEWWQSCRLPVNWKLATAAFMEGYHVPQTHPQLLPSRMPKPVRSVHPVVADQPVLHAHTRRRHGRHDARERHPHRRGPAEHRAAVRSRRGDGRLAQHPQRRGRRTGIGRGAATCPTSTTWPAAASPTRSVSAFPHYFILPTYSSASSYRIRPLGPEETLFEIWSLTRIPPDQFTGKPTPPEPMAPDDPRWPPIPAQDFSNLPQQQKGLHSKGFEYMRLSRPDRGADLELRTRHRRLPRRPAVRHAGTRDPEDQHHHRRADRRSRSHRASEAR